MRSADTGIPLAQVVAVVAALPGGREQVGSGYLVGGRLVLTAAHCTRDKATNALPLGLRVIRASDGAAAKVTDVVATPALDVAVLRLTDAPWAPDLPAPLFARVDRTRSGILRDCAAIGFPLFQRDRAQRARHTAELHGIIYQTDEAEAGRLLLREPLLTSIPKLERGSAADAEEGGTAWGGLSGALVFQADRALGVVVEHHPRQGSTAVQLVAIHALSERAEVDAATRRVADELGLPPVDRLAWAVVQPVEHYGDRDSLASSGPHGDLLLELLEEDWHNHEHLIHVLEARLRVTNRSSVTKQLCGWGLAGTFAFKISPDPSTANVKRIADALRHTKPQIQHQTVLLPDTSTEGWYVATMDYGPPEYEVMVYDEVGNEYRVRRPAKQWTTYRG